MKYVIPWVLVIFFLSCKNPSSSDNSCSCTCKLQTALAVKNNCVTCADDSAAFKLIAMLNESKIGSASEFARTHFNLEQIRYNGFRGFSLSEDDTSIWNAYAIYRLTSYYDDVDHNTLLGILVKANKQMRESSSSLCNEEIQNIEGKYLSYFLDAPAQSPGRNINEFRPFVSKYPNSSRIKYLWATILYKHESVDSALMLFKSLSGSGYYKLPIVRLLISYYDGKNFDSTKLYANELSKIDSAACNVGKISIGLKEQNNALVISECQKCLTGKWGMKDSIKAELYLAQYQLQNKNFSTVDSLFARYQTRNKEFVLDSFKIWESGEVYDLYMRSLFLRNKYRQLKSFALFEVGYVGELEIKNAEDLKKLVRKYYLEYVESSGQNFESFYKKHFQ
jgi:hypothetical protein